MNYIRILFLLLLLSCQALSPTKCFLDNHSIHQINQTLHDYGITSQEKELFAFMINQETDGFLGYHGGCSDYRLFQDILKFTIEEILEIPIREDFHFLRTPGNPTFIYSNAFEFIQQKAQHVPYLNWDTHPHIQQHILSLNIPLYQSYDKPWDLTPRYFLENQSWTHPYFKNLLTDFFRSIGVSANELDALWFNGKELLPQNRGFILQFFNFSDDQVYVAHSGGKPIHYISLQDLFSHSHYHYPQLRLIMNNHYTLNPYSPLIIKRYDSLSEKQRSRYESGLRSLIRNLAYDSEKAQNFKEILLGIWYTLD